jgi:hypothetical protein
VSASWGHGVEVCRLGCHDSRLGRKCGAQPRNIRIRDLEVHFFLITRAACAPLKLVEAQGLGESLGGLFGSAICGERNACDRKLLPTHIFGFSSARLATLDMVSDGS